MIVMIIMAKCCVICRKLRQITQTEALIYIAIMRNPNPIIVLLYKFLNYTYKDKSAHKTVINVQQSTCKKTTLLLISLQPFVRSKASSKLFQSLNQMNVMESHYRNVVQIISIWIHMITHSIVTARPVR